ncbi:hypothetical protein Nos7524_1429 [Nostoc sp. PCC 7524]|uniref:DUF3226 domain-containing protein n=1 Tax=Nostoc sp. (strain ATCC 29411 / PCC 7524) TaxID=28072 RepID=UPI00029F271C|nr:DUF3226 domain-containing protein [Nostoc sp. PCC 7524]AFY47307.1 hypothetical protein Nos7524_1429 [Nostoc sp. PCC 7524]
MSSKSQQLSQPKLLIGEGSEEVLFFKALLNYLKITDVQVENYGGKQGLGNYLQQLYLRPGYREIVSLGITRDADDSAKSAFDSVCSYLKNAGLSVPIKPNEITGNNPQISVLILPDYQDNGMLEDVCLEAVKTDPAMQCVDDYFQCVNTVAKRQPKTKDMAKARIRAWLSSQIEPDKRLGEAAQAGYLPWNSPAFDSIKQFLQSL